MNKAEKEYCESCAQHNGCGYVCRGIEYRCDRVFDFSEGYQQAIDKACDWIDGFLDCSGWIEYQVPPEEKKRIIEEFRNKMEETTARDWADEHPKQSLWRPVTDLPKDGEYILMKLSNGEFGCAQWVDDGKGFNERFLEINFGDGAMFRLPVQYDVVAWRPLTDVINECDSMQNNLLLTKK